MQSITIRNVLLVLLTMTSGCVDAISFLALGQVFTAAMTGNTVLFGLAVAHANGLAVTGYAVALLAFATGAATAATMLKRYQSIPGWNFLVTISLYIEWGALALFAIVISVYPETALTVPRTCLLIALLSFAMGVQSVTARRIGVTGVTTTVITSTLTGLVEAIVWKTASTISLSRTTSGNHTQPSKNKISIKAIILWLTIIVFYGIGAGICGVIEIHFYLQAIWLPFGIIFAIILTATVSWISVPVNQQKSEISM